jgi:hypothetical protein
MPKMLEHKRIMNHVDYLDAVFPENAAAKWEQLKNWLDMLAPRGITRRAADGLWDCANCENRKIGGTFTECPNCGTARR